MLLACIQGDAYIGLRCAVRLSCFLLVFKMMYTLVRMYSGTESFEGKMSCQQCHQCATTFAGPICGVIAAGLEYGDYCCYGSTYGERLRFAATYVSAHLQAHSCLGLAHAFGITS